MIQSRFRLLSLRIFLYLLPYFLCLFTGLFLVTSCRSQDPRQERPEKAQQYSQQLQEETQRLLSPYSRQIPLFTCLRLARERNLTIAAKDLATRLSAIDRKQSFAAFLPQVEVNFNYSNTNHPYLGKTNLIGAQFQLPIKDAESHQTLTQVMFPIFAPNAWLLYISASHGEVMHELIKARTEQMVQLQIIKQYYQILICSAEIRSLQSKIQSLTSLKDNIASYVAQQLVLENELRRVQIALSDAERRLDSQKRRLSYEKSLLLEQLNLWPLIDINLEPHPSFQVDLPIEYPISQLDAPHFLTIPLEEWLFQALSRRFELMVSDQNQALQKNEIRRAIANFLPAAVAYTNHYALSESLLVNPQFWLSGVQTSLSLFKGFRNVAGYKKAKIQEQESFRFAEEQAMSIIIQTIQGYQQIQDLQASCDLADRMVACAKEDLKICQARYREGLSELSQVLSLQQKVTEAEATQEKSQYYLQLSVYVFYTITGASNHRLEQHLDKVLNRPWWKIY